MKIFEDSGDEDDTKKKIQVTDKINDVNINPDKDSSTEVIIKDSEILVDHLNPKVEDEISPKGNNNNEIEDNIISKIENLQIKEAIQAAEKKIIELEEEKQTLISENDKLNTQLEQEKENVTRFINELTNEQQQKNQIDKQFQLLQSEMETMKKNQEQEIENLKIELAKEQKQKNEIDEKIKLLQSEMDNEIEKLKLSHTQEVQKLQISTNQVYQKGYQEGQHYVSQQEETKRQEKELNKQQRKEYVDMIKQNMLRNSQLYKDFIASNQQQQISHNSLQYNQRIQFYNIQEQQAQYGITMVQNMRFIQIRVSQEQKYTSVIKKYNPNSNRQEFDITIVPEIDNLEMIIVKDDESIKIQIQKSYGNDNVPFYREPKPMNEILGGPDGEYTGNQSKLINTAKKLSEKQLTHIGIVRGDGNCFFRSFIIQYMLLKISETQNNLQALNYFFNSLLNIEFQEPMNIQAYFSGIQASQLVKFAKQYLTQKFSSFISQSNFTPLQNYINSLNDYLFDFSIQIMAKSLLILSYRECQNKFDTEEDLKNKVLPLNTEGGDTYLNYLLGLIFNCNSSVLSTTSNDINWEDIKLEASSTSEKLQPFFLSSQFGIPTLCLWFKTGHYYYFLTQQQYNQIFYNPNQMVQNSPHNYQMLNQNNQQQNQQHNFNGQNQQYPQQYQDQGQMYSNNQEGQQQNYGNFNLMNQGQQGNNQQNNCFINKQGMTDSQQNSYQQFMAQNQQSGDQFNGGSNNPSINDPQQNQNNINQNSYTDFVNSQQQQQQQHPVQSMNNSQKQTFQAQQNLYQQPTQQQPIYQQPPFESMTNSQKQAFYNQQNQYQQPSQQQPLYQQSPVQSMNNSQKQTFQAQQNQYQQPLQQVQQQPQVQQQGGQFNQQNQQQLYQQFNQPMGQAGNVNPNTQVHQFQNPQAYTTYQGRYEFNYNNNPNNNESIN